MAAASNAGAHTDQAHDDAIEGPAFVSYHTAPKSGDAERRRAETQGTAFRRRRVEADREVEVEVLSPDPDQPLTFEDTRNAVPTTTTSPLFKPPGYQTIPILAGLGLLSGSMLLLGLLAGYVFGLRREGSERSATGYPLPASVATLAAFAPSSTGRDPDTAEAKSPSMPAAAVTSSPVARPAARAVPAKAGPTPLASTEDLRSAPEISSQVTPLRGRGYTIQIEAVTDKKAADWVVAKLRKLGYQSYAVATPIGRKTWYNVHVSPFATEDEARRAEAKLHVDRKLKEQERLHRQIKY